MMRARLIKLTRNILLVCSLAGGNALAQVKHASATGVHFVNNDWKGILALAKKLHKPIFVDAYTSWCAPCQEMKQTIFKDRNIAARFNTGFVNVAIDVEKGIGVAFADKYQVTAYPTLLFINADGEIIKRLEGFADAKTLADAATNIK